MAVGDHAEECKHSPTHEEVIKMMYPIRDAPRPLDDLNTYRAAIRYFLRENTLRLHHPLFFGLPFSFVWSLCSARRFVTLGSLDTDGGM